MTGYLLDTSVLSLLTPGRPDLTAELAAWIALRNTELNISVVTVAEIEQGIAKLRRLGGTRPPDLLDAWLGGILEFYAERVLPIDTAVAVMAGTIADASSAIGMNPGHADVYIAATAKVHGLRLLTRNLKHFAPLEIDAIDPLVTLPD